MAVDPLASRASLSLLDLLSFFRLWPWLTKVFLYMIPLFLQKIQEKAQCSNA